MPEYWSYWEFWIIAAVALVVCTVVGYGLGGTLGAAIGAALYLGHEAIVTFFSRPYRPQDGEQ